MHADIDFAPRLMVYDGNEHPELKDSPWLSTHFWKGVESAIWVEPLDLFHAPKEYFPAFTPTAHSAYTKELTL